MLAILRSVLKPLIMLWLGGALAGVMWQTGDHFVAVAIALGAIAWYMRWNAGQD